MCVADGDGCRIGSIIRRGDDWQVEQLAYHKADLLFADSSIARHHQLHLARCVLGDRDPLLRQRQNGDTSRLGDLDGCGHVFAKEQCLDGCLCWLVLGDDLAQLLIDSPQASRVRQRCRGHDRIAGEQTEIAPCCCQDRVAHVTKAGVDAQDEAFVAFHLFSPLSPAQLSFTHTYPRPLADNQVVEQFDLQQLARLDQGAGHLDILRAGMGATTGMVVRDNDRGALEQDRPTRCATR